MKNSFVRDKSGYKNLMKYLLKLNIKDAIIEYKIIGLGYKRFYFYFCT